MSKLHLTFQFSLKPRLGIVLTLITAALAMVVCTPVSAHSADRGFILLLPTALMMIGGTLAVAVSIVLVAFIKPGLASRLSDWSKQFVLPAGHWQTTISLLSLVGLCTLVVAGLTGSTDPLSNPLPLTIWTLGWVLLTLLHAVLGHLWRYLNPWSGLITLLNHINGGSTFNGRLPLPEFLGYFPAVVGFALFAWFELISIAPEDPPTLARITIVYWLFHFFMIYLFGQQTWLRRGEPFSVFFRFIALLSPFSIAENANTRWLRLSLPGASILRHDTLHWSGGVFVLLTLATVSFDGLNKTFWWFQLNDINPLAFAGRSTVTLTNTVGLIVLFVLLTSVYLLALWIGWQLTAKSVRFSSLIGHLALALLPISLAYHFAHFLGQILVNTQYSLKAFSDPFATGIDLLGFRDLSVSTSFLSHHASVELIWLAQLLAVVIAHAVSAVLAHLLALRLCDSHGAAVRVQTPLAVLMILYTWFGLWLLSTATGI